mmetsp:Transcript_1160/g.4847  ORF Transcript_1160/g.4847 Transcript_1160/m.4847 type:complete len:202 (+) Transcript_1160:97-702(+)
MTASASKASSARYLRTKARMRSATAAEAPPEAALTRPPQRLRQISRVMAAQRSTGASAEAKAASWMEISSTALASAAWACCASKTRPCSVSSVAACPAAAASASASRSLRNSASRFPIACSLLAHTNSHTTLAISYVSSSPKAAARCSSQLTTAAGVTKSRANNRSMAIGPICGWPRQTPAAASTNTSPPAFSTKSRIGSA